jgi:hypothetical protein
MEKEKENVTGDVTPVALGINIRVVFQHLNDVEVSRILNYCMQES